MRTAIILDRVPLMRSAIRSVLKATQLDVIAETDSCDEAFAVIKELAPNLIILDLQLGDQDGLAFLSQLRRFDGNIRILVLSDLDVEHFALRSARAGACAYVSKSGCLTGLRHVINSLRYGYSVFPQRIFPLFHKQALPSFDEMGEPLSKLSNREVMVLQYLCDGATNKQIAEALKIDPRTVSTYKNRIFHKLKINNILDLVHQPIMSAVFPKHFIRESLANDSSKQEKWDF